MKYTLLQCAAFVTRLVALHLNTRTIKMWQSKGLNFFPLLMFQFPRLDGKLQRGC